MTTAPPARNLKDGTWPGFGDTTFQSWLPLFPVRYRSDCLIGRRIGFGPSTDACGDRLLSRRVLLPDACGVASMVFAALRALIFSAKSDASVLPRCLSDEPKRKDWLSAWSRKDVSSDR